MKKTKRFFTAILAAVLVLSLLPAGALSEGEDLTVSGGTEGTDYTYESGVLLIKTAAELTISGTTTTDTVLVEKDVDANLTLSGVNIDVSGTFGLCAFTIADDSKGDVHITLAGDNVLKSGIKCAGLQKNGFDINPSVVMGTLTIGVDDGVAGSLTAIGGGGGAGIGGGLSRHSSNIIISGGTVTATGGDRAHSNGNYDYSGGAGIGGGGSSCVYSNTAAGLGSHITISGGTVTAKSSRGAGIGGGGNVMDAQNVPGGGGTYITISGGTVIATGATGIGGGGRYGGGSGGPGNYITISGGTVTATGNYGAGIGGGIVSTDRYRRGGYGSNIAISGGTVTATGSYGAGIGGGGYGGDGSDITISGGMVTATGSEGGAGIGAGGGFDYLNRYADGRNITISGGTVTADSTGAGIGGGADGTCGNVTISGGSVKTNLIGGKVGGVYADATVKAADGMSVYRTTVTLQGGNAVNAAISSLSISLGGEARAYGVNDMFTDANGKLYLYLPGSAITAAAQTTNGGMPPVLANYTGSIETTNDNQAAGTLNLWEPPTVTGVAVSPVTIEVQKGTAQQFAATVSGTNNPSQAVTWSVSGNSSAGTVISSGGLLTVDADETAGTLTVTATSAADGAKSGTAAVTVTTAPPAPSYGILLNHGGTFTFPSAAAGYGEQTAESVTVLNTGNRATGALTIGLSGDTAAFALSKESISDINVSGTDGFTVKPITGLGAGTYTATVTLSGGSVTPQTFDVSFTVNAAPATTHTVTLNQAAGGTATASHTGAAAGTTVTLGISLLANNYSFVRWDVSPSVTWTSGSAYSRSAAFTMPNENVTITPVYQDNGGDDYFPRSLTDRATGITVSGSGIYRNAQLTVSPLTLHVDAACDAIREAQANGQLILGFDISLSRGFIAPLTISIPVDSRYNDRTVTILHCVNGRLETIIATVVNGVATFAATELSPFAVTTGSLVPDEITGIPNTGDTATPWGFVLIGLAAACASYMVMKRRKA